MTYNIYHTRTDALGRQDTIRVATTDDRETAWEIYASLVAIARPNETYELREEDQ